MNINITKSEFQMMMDTLGEGLSIIIIKELNKEKIPNSFNKDKFLNMIDKIIKQANAQGIELKSDTPNIPNDDISKALESFMIDYFK